MAILYQTAEYKSASTIAIVILGPTAKVNSHPYIWQYGNYYGDKADEEAPPIPSPHKQCTYPYITKLELSRAHTPRALQPS